MTPLFSKQNYWYWLQKLGITISSLPVFWSNTSLAQIIPDNTLPSNSNVRQEDNTSIIEGGTKAGGNLFHSFQEFSVPSGGTAFFNNATDVQNIMSRVTGDSVSNINGLIRANGKANLFLINPNGIIFGQNASLNIGGSFLATTANSLKFADGREFSAKVPQTTPLLTLSVPIGLQFDVKTEPIQVNGSGGLSLDTDQSIDNTVGLQVLPGKSLALVGGNVSLDGGILQATGGRVELGGLAVAGTVGLSFDSNHLQLSFPADVARADVSLSNASVINVVAENGGSIAVNARNLDVLGASTLVAGIGSELGEVGSQAGDITLNATGTVKFEERSQIINSVNSNAIGNGGNITIQGESILFTRSTLSSFTNARGNAGDITLQAKDSVTFQDSSGTFTFVNSDAVGNGANIIIQATYFSLLNGSAFVSTSDGQGNSGNVTVDAKGSVTFAGVDASGIPSAVFTNSSNTSKSGDITIRASSLSLRDGANLDTSTSGSERAGNITIETSGSVSLTGVDGGEFLSVIRSQVNSFSTGSGGNISIKASSLSLEDGAQINSNTQAQGNAGNIKLEISGAVSLAGVGKGGDAGGIFSSVESDATGLGGDINIQANSFSVSGGARLFASTLGQGNAGNINVNVRDAIAFDGTSSNNRPSGVFTTVEPNAIGNAGNINFTARSIRLDNQAAISAITTSGNGGNINLQVQDILLLRRNSIISTSAGTAGQGGDGGNITINAPNGFIVAVPKENSDITANAYTGKGGRIDIKTVDIFGIQPRESQTFMSDITASSELGVDGSIELNTPDVNSNQALVELPKNLVDASEKIIQSCTPRRRQNNTFVVTGRTGMPLNPREPLRQRAVITQWITLDEEADTQVKPTRLPEKPKPIVEAQGWVVDKRGDVHLVAQVPQELRIQESEWATPRYANRSQNKFCTAG
ncbi:MAG: filamentous hemagglutinin N-terminal domain-containing protein [Nostoc sp. EkiNYC01]|nr:S-layer family protein [Nostoc sp. EkiNYC01]